MATQTRTQSGVNVVYSITSQNGAVCTVTANNSTPGGGISYSIAGTGMGQDGMQALSVLLIQLASEIQP